LTEIKRENEDNPILDALTDISQSCAQNFTQEQLLAYWAAVFPELERYLDPKRSHVEYSLAIGCMGDVSAKISPANFVPFFEKSVKMAFMGLDKSNHSLVRQNSIYALGCLCRAGGNRMQQVVEPMVNILQPICQMNRGDSDKKARLLRDNAFSTLGSLIAHVDLPDDQFIPLFGAFLNGLPLEEDFSENRWVLTSILIILENKKQELVKQYFQQIYQVLKNALNWKDIPQDVQQGAQNCVFILEQQLSQSSTAL